MECIILLNVNIANSKINSNILNFNEKKIYNINSNN